MYQPESDTRMRSDNANIQIFLVQRLAIKELVEIDKRMSGIIRVPCGYRSFLFVFLGAGVSPTLLLPTGTILPRLQTRVMIW
jgi:hypothetical protein